MSSTINFDDLTLNVEEARETNDLVFEDVYLKPNSLSEVHGIRTGIIMSKRIPILGQYGLVGKESAGDCTSNDESGQIPVSEKTWLPKLITFRLTHCQEQVPDLLKFWKKAMIAADTWEDVDNEMLAFIESRGKDATLESIYRLSSFGDTNATNVGAGSGSETITAGVDIAYFTPIDGLWKQIFTDQSLGTPLSYRAVIAENALASKALQLALAATTAIDAMRLMFENIDPRAFKNGNLGYQMTRSLHNNWIAFLEDKSLAFTLDRAEKGKVTKWSYRGIPITVRYDWDENILQYHDLGLTYYLPHRMILTKVENIPVGTSDEKSFDEFRSFYDMKDKKHYMDVAYKIDVKLLLEYELASAY